MAEDEEEEEEPGEGPDVELGELSDMFNDETLTAMGTELADQGIRKDITLLVRRPNPISLTAAPTYTRTRAVPRETPGHRNDTPCPTMTTLHLHCAQTVIWMYRAEQAGAYDEGSIAALMKEHGGKR